MLSSFSRLFSITFNISVGKNRRLVENRAAWAAVIRSLLTIQSSLGRVVLNIEVVGDKKWAVEELRECVD